MSTVAALLCAATLCCDAGAQQDAKQAEKALIKVGAVSSIAVFPEATPAVRAYFDTVNAAGGIRGRKFQLIVEDDKGQPEAAARSARKLVEQDQVVANVGSASTLECAVNGPYYAERATVSIQGTGVDPTCFSSPNIAPVNTGPYGSLAVALKFLSAWHQRRNQSGIGDARFQDLERAQSTAHGHTTIGRLSRVARMSSTGSCSARTAKRGTHGCT